jgi:hypothetical protein
VTFQPGQRVRAIRNAERDDPPIGEVGTVTTVKFSGDVVAVHFDYDETNRMIPTSYIEHVSEYTIPENPEEIA